MSDARGVRKVEWPENPATKDQTEMSGGHRKLAVMNPPPRREKRPVTNLGEVFGRFAELQQQINEQVVALGDLVHHQRQDIALAVAQLPELREQINWLIASFHEQSDRDESVRERSNRGETALEALLETSRSIQETQVRRQSAIDEAVASLLKAKAMPAPSGPQA